MADSSHLAVLSCLQTQQENKTSLSLTTESEQLNKISESDSHLIKLDSVATTKQNCGQRNNRYESNHKMVICIATYTLI